MTTTDHTRPPARRRSRIGFLLRWGIPAFALLVLTCYLLRGVILAPLILRAANAALHPNGLSLSVEKLSGDWLRNLRLFGLRLEALEVGGALRELEVEELSLEYDLWRLLRKRDLGALSSLRGRGTRLVLDLDAPAAEPEIEIGTQEPEPSGFSWPTELPRVELLGLRLTAGLPAGRQLTVREGRLLVRSEQAGSPATIDAELDGLSLLEADGSRQAVDAQVRARYEGGVFELEQLAADGRELLRGTLDASDPKRLAWNLRGDLAQGSLASSGSLSGGELRGRLEISHLECGTLIELAAPSIELPRGRLDLATDLRLPLADPLAAEGDLRLKGTQLSWGGRPPAELEVVARIEGRVLDVSLLELVQGTNLFSAQGWRLPLSDDLQDVWPALAGDLELEITDLPSLLGTATEETEVPPHHITLQGRLAAGALTVETGVLHCLGGRLDLERALIRPARPEEWRSAALELEARAAFDDLAPLGELIGRKLSGSLSGRLSGSGSLDAPEVSLELEASGLETDGLPLDSVSLAAEGTLESFSVSRLELQGSFGELALAGSLTPLLGAEQRIVIEELESRSELGEIVLQAPVSIEREDDRVFFEELVLEGPDSRLRASAARTPEGQEIVVEGSVHRVQLSNETPPLDLLWSARWARERLTIEHLEARTEDATLVELAGEVPLDLLGPELLCAGKIDLSGRIACEQKQLEALSGLLGIQSQGALRGELELGGEWRALSGHLRLQSSALKLARADTPILPEPLDILLELQLERGIEIRELRFGCADLELSARGTLDASNDVTTWLGPDRPSPGSIPIELEGRLSSSDLSRWSELVPGTRRLAGKLEAELGLSGPLKRPLLRGSFSLSEGSLRTQSDFPGLEQIELAARLEPGSLEIERCRAELGGAPLGISGRMTFPESGVELDLALEGENLLLYRTRGLRLRSDAALSIQGPFANLLVSGQLALRESRYVKEIDLLSAGRSGGGPKATRGFQIFAIREGALANARFDVAVSSVSPLRIENRLIRGGLRPDLLLSGTGSVPILSGPVYLDPTRINLPSGQLFLQSGTFDFTRDDPFLPRMQIQGNARLRGYDVKLSLSGPYDQPEITLSSSPPLSNEDLLLLVTTGRRPEGRDATASAAAGQVGVFLAQDYLERWMSDESTESGESFLSRLEVQRGRDVSRTGAETTEVSFRLKKDVLTSNDTLYLTGENDVHDRFNYGLRVVFRFR